MSSNLLLPVMLSKWRALLTALVYFFLLYNHAKNIPPTTFNFRPWLCPIDGLSSSKWMSHCCHQSKSSTLLSLVVYITRISSLRISSSMLLLLPNQQIEVPNLRQFVGHGPRHSLSWAWIFPLLLRRMGFPWDCAGVTGCNSYQENRVYFS